MTITKHYSFHGYGKLRPYWKAEQKIPNGILSYVEVVHGRTMMKAITTMLNKIHSTKN